MNSVIESPPEPRQDRFPVNREVDKAAAELREKSTVPRPPSKSMNWEASQEYLKLFTPEMWAHTSAYLYRLRPKIIRQLHNPDAPNYIDVFGAPFDLDYITKRHGGGKYLIECTDSAAQKDLRHLFRCTFEIDEIRTEPILTFEELDVTARENMSYLQMLQHRGIFDSKGRLVEKQQPAPAANGGAISTEVVKEILGFVSQMNAGQAAALREKLSEANGGIGKSVGDILLEQMRQNDPNKQTATMLALVTAMKEMMKPADGGSDKTLAALISAMEKFARPADGANLDKLLQMQSENYKAMLSMVDRITQAERRRDDERDPRRDELDQLDKLLGFAQKLTDLRGPGGRRNGWDIGLDYAKELGVPLMQSLTSFMALRRGGAAPVAGGPPPPLAFDPYQRPDLARAAAQSMQQPNPAPPPQPPPPPGPPPAGMGGAQASTQLIALVQSYGNLVVQALNSGTRGCDFAENLCGLLGTATHAAIAQHGEETLLQTMLAVPEIAMFGEPRLRLFAHEFIHFDEILAKESEEEDAGDDNEAS